MPVIVHQHPLEHTRRVKSCKWVGEAVVDGRTYIATSRMSPPCDIARQLVADGVPDDEMHIYSAGLEGCLIWRSFYQAAGFTYEESTTVAVRMARWVDPTVTAARLRGTFREKPPSSGSPVPGPIPDEQVDKNHVSEAVL
jgi:hypothetical protein